MKNIIYFFKWFIFTIYYCTIIDLIVSLIGSGQNCLDNSSYTSIIALWIALLLLLLHLFNKKYNYIDKYQIGMIVVIAPFYYLISIAIASSLGLTNIRLISQNYVGVGFRDEIYESTPPAPLSSNDTYVLNINSNLAVASLKDCVTNRKFVFWQSAVIGCYNPTYLEHPESPYDNNAVFRHLFWGQMFVIETFNEILVPSILMLVFIGLGVIFKKYILFRVSNDSSND